MVARSAEKHGASRASVLRWLRRFWERGQNQNALLPDYANSGARGKRRTANSGVKRGRPSKSSGHEGVNVDDATRAIFRSAIARYCATHPATEFVRRAAYRQMIAEFYEVSSRSNTPSFGQFNYWLEKDESLVLARKAVAYAPFVAVQHVASSNKSGAFRTEMVRRIKSQKPQARGGLKNKVLLSENEVCSQED
jgi:hypothetical protein